MLLQISRSWADSATYDERLRRHRLHSPAAEPAERTGLDGGELERWDDVSRTLHVPFHSGVISRFEGAGISPNRTGPEYRRRYGDIRSLDRILEAEGDTVNRVRAGRGRGCRPWRRGGCPRRWCRPAGRHRPA